MEKNNYIYHDNYVEVKVKNKNSFMIDAEDIELIKGKKWNINNSNAVVTYSKNKTIFLHRLLMNPPEDMEIDHINRNSLDNRRENLRICTHAENMRNRKSRLINNNYKGVTYRNDRYVMNIGYNNKRTVLYLTNEIAAANAYNYYAEKYYGEFACLNDAPFMEKEEWEKYWKRPGNTSNYRGVSLAHKNKWLSQICNGKETIRLGYFESEIEAAKAYNDKVIELGLNKNKLNIIQEEG